MAKIKIIKKKEKKKKGEKVKNRIRTQNKERVILNPVVLVQPLNLTDLGSRFCVIKN